MPNYLLAAELANSGKLPSGLLFALVPLLVLVVALDVYCLIDLARARSVRNARRGQDDAALAAIRDQAA